MYLDGSHSSVDGGSTFFTGAVEAQRRYKRRLSPSRRHLPSPTNTDLQISPTLSHSDHRDPHFPHKARRSKRDRGRRHQADARPRCFCRRIDTWAVWMDGTPTWGWSECVGECFVVGGGGPSRPGARTLGSLWAVLGAVYWSSTPGSVRVPKLQNQSRSRGSGRAGDDRSTAGWLPVAEQAMRGTLTTAT